ncbi:MAG: RcnB family protein [Candidatus Sphingomonas colombiensis]|nr:RcnB family protein [Sphingomonas sp.]WEK43108.1 MAG: RcnB family protein [Sphingomonas sp.]
MKKLISVTLMAAASLLPLSASAQDNAQRGDYRGNGDRGERPQHQAQAPQAQQRPQSNGGDRGQAQQRPQWNGGDRGQAQGRPQWNGGDRGQAQQRPQWNGGDRGQAQGRPQWNGGDRGQAQERSQWNGGDREQAQRPQRQPDGQPGGWQRPDASQGGNWAGRDQSHGQWREPGRPGGSQQARPNGDRGPNWQDRGQYNRDPRRGWNDPRYNGGDRYARDNRGQWNRDWRRDTRYNWSGYRYQNRQAFHLPRYYAPYGWSYGYRRFSIGMTLSNILFAQNYWIDDPWSYRLPEVYGPYRWVRYYNDALLVDIYSGQVVDVINDIFW